LPGSTDWYALDPFQQGLVVSTSLAGALVASAAAAIKLGDKLGSKRELQLAAVFYAIGAITQGAAGRLLRASTRPTLNRRNHHLFLRLSV
jgi:MFS family permease